MADYVSPYTKSILEKQKAFGGPAFEADPSDPSKTTGIMSHAIFGMPQGPGDWGRSEARKVEMTLQPGTWGVDDARGQDQAYMDWLKQRAAGQGLDATRIGEESRAGSRSDLLSYMASRGGQSAANRRDAQFGIAGASQGIRQQQAASEEEERQRYRQMVAEEQARQWASEQAEAKRRQGWMTGQEILRQGALQMGSDDTYSIARQREAEYEQQKKQKLAAARVKAGLAAEEAAGEAATVKGMGDILTFGLSKVGSDERSKENIKPARGEARALLQALKQAEEDEALGAELGARPGRDVSRAMGAGPRWSAQAAAQKQKDSSESPALLAALREEGPMSWSYKSGQGLDGKKRMGTMAQTVERAVPGVVTTDGKGRKALKVPELVAAYAGLFAEQQKQIEELQQRVGRRGASGAAEPSYAAGKLLGGVTARRPLQEGSFLPQAQAIVDPETQPLGPRQMRLPPADVLAMTGGPMRPWASTGGGFGEPEQVVKLRKPPVRLPPADVLGMTGGADPEFGLVARRR